MISVELWDSTGNKRQTAELPDDAPVNQIMDVLVDRLNLPRTSPDGQPMSYKFHHKKSGRQLSDDQTFADAGVEDGDILRVVPEITAGLSGGAVD
ncbi:MAG: EsaB/YukD family protein [Candidatus Brocadiia bacterium]